MTTSDSATIPSPTSPRHSLRLTLAAHPGPGKLGGAWWPQSRDLGTELADLVDSFPDLRGRGVRRLFSRPDWDLTLRKIDTKRGVMTVGSFPSDDTHRMVLSMSAAPVRLTLLVVPPDADADTAPVLMAAAASADPNSAAPLLADHDIV
jgi:hypothetical protein